MRRSVVLAGLLTSLAIASPAQAATTGHHHTTYPYEVWGLDRAADGDLWFAEVDPGSPSDRIVHLDPTTGSTTPYTDELLTSINDLAVAADGTVWIAGWGAGLGHLEPVTGEITWQTYENGDEDIATVAVGVGPDGTVWFVDADAGGLGSVDPDTGVVSYVDDPGVELSLSPDVVVAGDGSVWYAAALRASPAVRRFDPETGAYSSPSDPDSLAELPYALAVDDAGDVWFTDYDTGGIGRIDAETETVAEAFTDPDMATTIEGDRSDLTAASDGTIWFAGNGILGRLDPTTGFSWVTGRLVEGNSENWVLEPREIVGDPAGGIWLTGEDVVAHHQPTCNGRVVTVDVGLSQMPTDGDDVIAGTPGDDQVSGGGGNDVMCGGEGHDQLRGGPGRDRIFGGAGGDGLRADAGGGLLAGGADGDALFGGSGADALRGGPGNDAIEGRFGADRLNGGEDGDGCDGGAGKDLYLACEGPFPFS